MSKRKENVAVIGAGLMGHGIAYLFASAGHPVKVQDPVADARTALKSRVVAICELLGTDPSVTDRVSGHAELKDAVSDADVVIEAAPEKLPLKQGIFAELDALAPQTAILTSNTSAIPITQISTPVRDKARVLGTHFWNPPHLVALVEVVTMADENRPAAERMMTLLRNTGQHPVLVKRDIPGFIGNRMQHALKREAIAIVASGVCSAEDLDDVVKLGFGARLAVLGPMEQSDLVGLNLTKDIHDTLIPHLDVTPHTHPYLNDLVAKGHLGMKTGRGFLNWTPESAGAVRKRLNDFLAEGARRRRRVET